MVSKEECVSITKLTKNEIAGFHSVWLATRDVKSPGFKKIFEPIWIQRARKIEIFSKNCGYPIELLDSRRVTFTLKPEVTLGFDPQTRRILSNLFYFLFGHDKESVFFKPPIYLAGEFFHINNDTKIWEELEKTGRGKKATSESIEKARVELRRQAYLAEVEFLRKAKTLAKDEMNVRSFNVTSWSTDGFPTCVVERTTIRPREKFENSLHESEKLLKKETSLAKDDSEKHLIENKKAYYAEILRALNLGKYSSAHLDVAN